MAKTTPTPSWWRGPVAELYRPGGNTEYRTFDDRGHFLVFDSGWREVAQPVLDWCVRGPPSNGQAMGNMGEQEWTGQLIEWPRRISTPSRSSAG